MRKWVLLKSRKEGRSEREEKEKEEGEGEVALVVGERM